MSGGVSIRQLEKSFSGIPVLQDIDLEVEPGQFVVLLGESGCGKSTLLRLVSGLEEDHGGSIHIAGRDVTHLDPKDRRIAMVFQSYALYPHMSVYDNIAFGMKIRKQPTADTRARVDQAAKVLKLDALLDRRPAQLSGGQRQRVAIGRAMVREPDVFLFDEPLSNLDAKLRGDMRVEIKRIHRALGATILYVTHDQIEAMTLADRIVLLNRGRIEQAGTPTDLYRDPDTLFAARFIGSPEINAIPVELTMEQDRPVARHGRHTFHLPTDVPRRPVASGKRALLAIRPEFLSLGGRDAEMSTEGHPVLLCEPTGSETFVVLGLDDAELRLRVPGLHHLEEGSLQRVGWTLSAAHLFDAETERRL